MFFMRNEYMENIYNYIDNSWVKSSATEFIDVINPATQELLTQTPLSLIDDVERAALSAANAFHDWKRTPVTERVQYLFKLKNALDDHFEELSRLITIECGKSLDESHGVMRPAIWT